MLYWYVKNIIQYIILIATRIDSTGVPEVRVAFRRARPGLVCSNFFERMRFVLRLLLLAALVIVAVAALARRARRSNCSIIGSGLALSGLLILQE